MRQTHLIWIVLPVLPVLLGFMVLGVLNDGAATLVSDTINKFTTTGKELQFFNAMVIYVAVGLFQVLGCAAVALYALQHIRNLPEASRRDSQLVLVCAIALVLIISIAVRQPGMNGALNISYRMICSVLVEASVAPHVLPASCMGGKLSPFAWLGLLPYMAGILAAACAAALVSTSHRREDLGVWADTLDHAFKATAFVLVASTIAMMLFYHLPLSVIGDEDQEKLARGFAQSMTLFWGIIFSLTLLAVFAPAQILLHRAIAAKEDVADDLRERIATRSTYSQARQILTTLAPLLVGSSASVVELLGSALGT